MDELFSLHKAIHVLPFYPASATLEKSALGNKSSFGMHGINLGVMCWGMAAVLVLPEGCELLEYKFCIILKILSVCVIFYFCTVVALPGKSFVGM